MNCKLSILFSTIYVVFGAWPAFGEAKHLGVAGKLYQVVEPDIATELEQQAVAKNHVEEDEFLNRVRTYQPEDLHPLPRATEDRTFLVDMTYTLDQDLVDGNGKVIYPRGFTFNPLDYVSFPGGLLVIDGDDPSQIKWFRANALCRKPPGSASTRWWLCFPAHRTAQTFGVLLGRRNCRAVATGSGTIPGHTKRQYAAGTRIFCTERVRKQCDQIELLSSSFCCSRSLSLHGPRSPVILLISASDVHWDEIELRFEGICICPRPPPIFYEEGEIWEYWEPFLVEGTVSMANYSAYHGTTNRIFTHR